MSDAKNPFNPLELVGLYRHFKGNYYYVTGICKLCSDKELIDGNIALTYVNVCKPMNGVFTRPLEEFMSTFDSAGNLISDRKDNVTGQTVRMQKVIDLDFQISSVSTEQLIKELQRRKDSPIHELDLGGLHSDIFCRDYVVGIPQCVEEDVVGIPFEDDEETVIKGVETLNVYFSRENAEENRAKYGKRAKVFKRVFIEVD